MNSKERWVQWDWTSRPNIASMDQLHNRLRVIPWSQYVMHWSSTSPGHVVVTPTTGLAPCHDPDDETYIPAIQQSPRYSWSRTASVFRSITGRSMLIVPRKPYAHLQCFVQLATRREFQDLVRLVHVTALAALRSHPEGIRVLTHGQDVSWLHVKVQPLVAHPLEPELAFYAPDHEKEPYPLWIPTVEERALVERVAEAWHVSEHARTNHNGWWYTWYRRGGSATHNQDQRVRSGNRVVLLRRHRRSFLARHLGGSAPLLTPQGTLTRKAIAILCWHYNPVGPQVTRLLRQAAQQKSQSEGRQPRKSLIRSSAQRR